MNHKIIFTGLNTHLLELVISFTFIFYISSSAGQPVHNQIDISGTNLAQYITTEENFGWYYFTKESKLKAEDFFSEFGNAFNLDENHQMKLLGVYHDDEFKNFQHYKFIEQYKGIDIEGSEFALHTEDGYIYLANGEITTGFNFDVSNFISEEVALQKALNSFEGYIYAWDDENMETELKKDLNDESATYYPKGIYKLTQKLADNWTIENYEAAFLFKIKTAEPYDLFAVFINANTGELIKKFSLLEQDACVNGNVVTVYQGTQSFGTMSRGFPNNDYILQDECRDGIITTKKHNAGGGYCWVCKDLIDASNNLWDGANSAAATNLWTIEKSWDYFKNIHSRSGSSNSTRDIRIWTYALDGSSSYDPDSYNKNYDLFFMQNSWEFLDVAGHEFTHAVVRHTTALGSESNGTEADALNESYGDIFGVMIDRYIFPSGPYMWTWVSGDFPGSTVYRNISDPHSSYTHQPDYYHSSYWSYAGDPHINGGVNNYWFYLYATGDAGLGISGVGIDVARRITYRAMTTIGYLGPTSTYAGARNATRQAAIDLYGSCSSQVEQLVLAWDAVGVSGTGYTYCCNLTGPTELCDDGTSLPVTYKVTSGTGSSYNWNIPVGWTPSSNPTTSTTYTLTSTATTTNKTLTVTASRPGQSASANKFVSFIDCDNCPPLCRFSSNEINKLNIYPNPASQFLYLQLPDTWEFCKGHVINAQGEVIKDFRLESNIGEIDIIDFPSGIYYLRIFYNEKVLTSTFEIVK